MLSVIQGCWWVWRRMMGDSIGGLEVCRWLVMEGVWWYCVVMDGWWCDVMVLCCKMDWSVIDGWWCWWVMLTYLYHICLYLSQFDLFSTYLIIFDECWCVWMMLVWWRCCWCEWLMLMDDREMGWCKGSYTWIDVWWWVCINIFGLFDLYLMIFDQKETYLTYLGVMKMYRLVWSTR